MEEILIHSADIFGTIVFAITGALRGVSRSLDLLGILVLSCTVGIGGGILRDAAIGATPAASLMDETYVLVCILAGLIVFSLPKRIRRLSSVLIIYFDAVGLGVFTFLGCAKAMNCGMPSITVVLAGVITAVGGGVLRDILVASVPAILKYDFYATASLFGGIVYLVMTRLNVNVFYTFLSVSFFVMITRIYAYRHKIELPKVKAAAARNRK